jgi:hypothetical protein
MKEGSWLLAFAVPCVIAWVLVASPRCWAQVAPSRSSFEGAINEFTRRITEELRAQDPEAADLFTKANEARERSDVAEAERLYRAVLERRPDFVHARRRLSSVVLVAGRYDQALAAARSYATRTRSWNSRRSRASTAAPVVGEVPLSSRPPATGEEGAAATALRDFKADAELMSHTPVRSRQWRSPIKARNSRYG